MNILRNPIGLGKVFGFLVGLAAFFTLPEIWPDAPERLRWGLLLWYLTFGAVIGAFGTSPQPGFIPVSMPWWLRAIGVGAWMNFVLSFFAWDAVHSMLTIGMGFSGTLASPYWIALEGAIVGLLIGFLATRLSKGAG